MMRKAVEKTSDTEVYERGNEYNPDAVLQEMPTVPTVNPWKTTKSECRDVDDPNPPMPVEQAIEAPSSVALSTPAKVKSKVVSPETEVFKLAVAMFQESPPDGMPLGFMQKFTQAIQGTEDLDPIDAMKTLAKGILAPVSKPEEQSTAPRPCGKEERQ